MVLRQAGGWKDTENDIEIAKELEEEQQEVNPHKNVMAEPMAKSGAPPPPPCPSPRPFPALPPATAVTHLSGRENRPLGRFRARVQALDSPLSGLFRRGVEIEGSGFSIRAAQLLEY